MESKNFTKRSNEVDKMSVMEELVNYVPIEHELVEGDYGSHFTTDEVNNISLMYIIILTSDVLLCCNNFVFAT